MKRLCLLLITLILLFVISGCNKVDVTQTTTTIEAGTPSVDIYELIDVVDYDNYSKTTVGPELNTSVLGTYTITYFFFDNETKRTEDKKFDFEVVDTTGPEITLFSNELSILINDVFEPLEYISSVDDNLDGAMNVSNVSVESNVNTEVKGTYYVNYFAKDLTGNESEASLQVNVVESIKLGDIMTSSNYAEISITNTSFTFSVKPTNPQGNYSFYPPSNLAYNETYFDVIGVIKNLGSDSENIKDILSITLIYDNKNNYEGFIVADDNGALNSSYSIAPSLSVKYHYIFAVPNNVQTSGKSVLLQININGLDELLYVVE